MPSTEIELKPRPMYELNVRSIEQLMEVFVARYYRNKGYLVLTEQMLGEKGIQRCDLAAVKTKKRIPNTLEGLRKIKDFKPLYKAEGIETVEFKSLVGDYSRGFEQCLGYSPVSDKVFIAIPGAMKGEVDTSKFMDCGINVMYVYANGLEIQNGAKTNLTKILEHYSDKELEQLTEKYGTHLKDGTLAVEPDFFKKKFNPALDVNLRIPGIFHLTRGISVDEKLFLFGRLTRFEQVILDRYVTYLSNKENTPKSLYGVVSGICVTKELDDLIDQALSCPELCLTNSVRSLGLLAG